MHRSRRALATRARRGRALHHHKRPPAEVEAAERSAVSPQPAGHGEDASVGRGEAGGAAILHLDSAFEDVGGAAEHGVDCPRARAGEPRVSSL